MSRLLVFPLLGLLLGGADTVRAQGAWSTARKTAAADTTGWDETSTGVPAPDTTYQRIVQVKSGLHAPTAATGPAREFLRRRPTDPHEEAAGRPTARRTHVLRAGAGNVLLIQMPGLPPDIERTRLPNDAAETINGLPVTQASRTIPADSNVIGRVAQLSRPPRASVMQRGEILPQRRSGSAPFRLANAAVVQQVGRANRARPVLQVGAANWIRTRQRGAFNTLRLRQKGIGNTARVRQEGTGNKVTVSQRSVGV